MRNKAGILCMILGALLLLGALVLLLFNQQEAKQAEQAAEALLPQLQAQIRENKDTTTQPTLPVLTPQELLTPEDLQMEEMTLDGEDYIGILSIPALELELPVMADWDYTRLKTAPCRYTGSLKSDDLVIMAHNYGRHFGRLKALVRGDSLFFTDITGATYGYEVMFTDVIAPNAQEEVISGDFDLTLFTCTYGGENRVVVYFDRADDE